MSGHIPDDCRHDPHDPDLFILRCPDCGREDKSQTRKTRRGRVCGRCNRLMGVTPVSKVSTASPGDGTRVMTDGGTSITGPGGDGPEPGTMDDGEPATDPVDPEMVAAYTPAFVVSSDAAERFVADYSVLESGWVRVRDWDGEVQKIPPHKINAIRHVRKERYGEGGRNGFKPEQLADEDLRERAREMGGAGGDE